METREQIEAGFWIRMLATWFDLLLIYCVLKILFYSFLLFHINLYLPTEFLFLILTITYSAVAISLKGQTIGKWLLNLKVVNKKNEEKLSITKSILRESILKLFSGLILFIGFFRIAFSRNKYGWHDSSVASKVIKIDRLSKSTIIWKTIGICSFTILFGGYVWGVSNLIHAGQKMELPKKPLILPFVERNLTEVKDISKITSDTIFIDWLNKNAKTPQEYAIQTASNHNLTLFGEEHGIKENLDFFNEIIPSLYHKAGIRCIGMECIPSIMNKKINELITGNTFDNKLALQIARSQPWKMWGMKGYWDVLETVWRLNKNLPDSCPKMRMVGIDENWDGPNLALVLPRGSDDGLKNVPIWEKLKLFTTIDDLVKLIYRDELLARNVEKEIIEKGDKGVVLIGSAHTTLHYGYPIINNNKILFVKARFGLLLSQKYKSDIGQILLWHSIADEADTSKALTSFMESIMVARDNLPVGFCIEDSPFGKLRDSNAPYFKTYKTICFEDITQGLIFLKPLDKLQYCTWSKDYISREMFLKYKLFYQLKSKQKISNSEEMNKYCEKASNEGYKF
jgi:uncharacterized RDD family membrane protein YckC